MMDFVAARVSFTSHHISYIVKDLIERASAFKKEC
jgi:hypothetical protein